MQILERCCVIVWARSFETTRALVADRGRKQEGAQEPDLQGVDPGVVRQTAPESSVKYDLLLSLRGLPQ